MNEILRFMLKRDKLTDGRTHVQKAFYNLPTTAFGRRWEIITCDVNSQLSYVLYILCTQIFSKTVSPSKRL